MKCAISGKSISSFEYIQNHSLIYLSAQAFDPIRLIKRHVFATQFILEITYATYAVPRSQMCLFFFHSLKMECVTGIWELKFCLAMKNNFNNLFEFTFIPFYCLHQFNNFSLINTHRFQILNRIRKKKIQSVAHSSRSKKME